jgi:hypothetical protein
MQVPTPGGRHPRLENAVRGLGTWRQGDPSTPNWGLSLYCVRQVEQPMAVAPTEHLEISQTKPRGAAFSTRVVSLALAIVSQHRCILAVHYGWLVDFDVSYQMPKVLSFIAVCHRWCGEVDVGLTTVARSRRQQ